MRWCLPLLVAAGPALACEAPVCLVPNDSLSLSRVITFDTLPTSMGIGRDLSGIVTADGARFGEHFAGMIRGESGSYDRFTGPPDAPLRIVPGPDRGNLGTMLLYGTTILHGHGPALFPRTEAIGEGSIAVLFDEGQAALALDIRGGEGGTATIRFYTRDGALLHGIEIAGLGEAQVSFLRQGQQADIAGILLENADPEGIGMDNLRFALEALLGA